jgi:hypothetical protein
MAVPPHGEGVLRQVIVHVRDPRIAPDLVAYIERMGFSARAIGHHTVEAFPHEDVPAEQARLELDLYISLWRALEERHDVTLLP